MRGGSGCFGDAVHIGLTTGLCTVGATTVGGGVVVEGLRAAEAVCCRMSNEQMAVISEANFMPAISVVWIEDTNGTISIKVQKLHYWFGGWCRERKYPTDL